MFRKMISFLLVVAFVFTVGKASIIIPVGAIDAEKTETKVLDTATMEDDFTDDCVMVILTNAESLKFRNYTAADFPEVACKSVEDLSSASAARVQAKLRGDEMETRDAGAAFMNRNVNVDTFRTILCLKLETPGKGNVLKAIRALEQREDVYYAGPNYIITLDLPTTTSNDASRGVVLPDDLPTVHRGWGADAIDLGGAWMVETGSSAVKVGVIDTGIDVSHPGLDSRVNSSLSRNFAPDNISATTDPSGHGTHVAGIIGGEGNDTLGVGGVCQNVTLVSLRVFRYDDILNKYIADCDDVVAAINYADGANIPILNVSLGMDFGGHTSMEPALEDYAGIAVCCAGNRGLDSDTGIGYYPGIFELDNIICVGASTQQNEIWSLSNYGDESVDLFAPGHNIKSCYPRSLCASSGCTGDGHVAYGYHYMSGTSMATPYVTGTAALLLSSHPGLTVDKIKELILNNTTFYEDFEGYCVTGGLLNAQKALTDPEIHQSFAYESISAIEHRKSCSECDYYSCLEEHTFNTFGRCLYCNYQELNNRMS